MYKKKAPIRKRKTYVGDFKVEDMSSPFLSQKFYALACAKIQEQQQEIERMRKKNLRLKRKVGDLKALVDLLEKKNFLSDGAASVLKVRNKILTFFFHFQM